MSTPHGFADGQTMLKQYFVTNWPNTPSSALPYVFENDKYSGNPDDDYMEFIVRETEAVQVTCGQPTAYYRVLGNVVGIIRGKLDDGSALTRIYADSLSNLFRNKLINGISMHSPRVVPVGRDESHYRINVFIPFQFTFVSS